jgi:hypothetical protein
MIENNPSVKKSRTNPVHTAEILEASELLALDTLEMMVGCNKGDYVKTA